MIFGQVAALPRTGRVHASVDGHLQRIECEVTAEVPADTLDRRRFGSGIAPGGVPEHVTAHANVVVLGDALPRAHIQRRTVLKHRTDQRVRWEVPITLDHDNVVAGVGYHEVVDGCLHVELLSWSGRGSE